MLMPNNALAIVQDIASIFLGHLLRVVSASVSACTDEIFQVPTTPAAAVLRASALPALASAP